MSVLPRYMKIVVCFGSLCFWMVSHCWNLQYTENGYFPYIVGRLQLKSREQHQKFLWNKIMGEICNEERSVSCEISITDWDKHVLSEEKNHNHFLSFWKFVMSFACTSLHWHFTSNFWEVCSMLTIVSFPECRAWVFLSRTVEEDQPKVVGLAFDTFLPFHCCIRLVQRTPDL